MVRAPESLRLPSHSPIIALVTRPTGTGRPQAGFCVFNVTDRLANPSQAGHDSESGCHGPGSRSSDFRVTRRRGPDR